MSTNLVLEAMADAFEAASQVLRQRARALDFGESAKVGEPVRDAVTEARAQHGQLGPRQTQVIRLLEEAGEAGTSSGVLSREMKYDQPNVYLTLQQLAERGFVEKDETSRPHTYRLGDRLADRCVRALTKYEESGAAGLGIPVPEGYSNVDGIVAKKIFVGPDGNGHFVVVRAGEILFTADGRGEAMDFYNGIKGE